MRAVNEILPGNAVLDAFPHDLRARILADGERVMLATGQVLISPDQPVHHIHFPERSLISLFKLMEDGDGMEVALLGRHGMVGLPALADQRHVFEAVVVAPGPAWRVKAEIVAEAMATSPVLRRLMFRYMLLMVDQVGQIAACNRLHSVDERCRRWLSTAADTMGDVLPVTHDALAGLLGVRRPGVTTILGALQRAGLLVQERGRIVILDRQGVAAGACECARAIRDGQAHIRS